MPVLKVSKDRFLTITKLGNTHQDENNAETIKIILPKTINKNDLRDCSIFLSFINQRGLGDVCDITEYIEDYSNDMYVIEVPMYQMFTYEPGVIEMWVKFLNPTTQMVAKTNPISFTIKRHRDIEGTVPEQEMSIIDNLIMKIDATAIKVDEVSERVQDIVEGDEQIVQSVLIGEIQEDDNE